MELRKISGLKLLLDQSWMIESGAICQNATIDDLKIVKILDSVNKKLLAISSDKFNCGLISKMVYPISKS
jgi:hypothetical protein